MYFKNKTKGFAFLVSNNHYQYWFKVYLPYTKYHRANGPALIHPNGVLQWWHEGTFVRNQFQNANRIK